MKTKIQKMEKKLGVLVEKYLNGYYNEKLDDFSKKLLDLDGKIKSNGLLYKLELFQRLLFLGQLVGLPTLHSILSDLGIQSSKHHSLYQQLCKKLSHRKLDELCSFFFCSQVRELLKKRGLKDSSCWSRNPVTLILDDSIFKQWLSKHLDEEFYDLFFSGQYKRTVFGWKILCLGIYIDGVFYPLFFSFVSKKNKEEKNGSINTAKKLLLSWGKWNRACELSAANKELEKEGINSPILNLSLDNGYSNFDLADVAKSVGLNFISVPAKSHLFEIDDAKQSLKNWIDNVFLTEEKKHYKEPKNKEKPFFIRKKAYYCSKKREVVLLIFRLNGSKKVSVIYSTTELASSAQLNLAIFSKTLRRHWFQRTYIEQFFKLLKHTLKIQEAKTQTKKQFQMKFFNFACIAVELQKLLCFLRKKESYMNKKGILALQRILVKQAVFRHFLQEQLSITSSLSMS